MIEEMQKTIKMLIDEIKTLTSEKAELKERIKQLENEITLVKKKTFKEETEKRRKM